MDSDGPAPSLFAQFMAEAVEPWRLELPDLDDPASVLMWSVAAPNIDGVCELDEDLTHPVDILTALLPDDIVDGILDALIEQPWPRTVTAAADLRAHFALDRMPPGAWTGLVERVDLYGEALEADLFDRGHDLLDWFRGRRPWPQLLRLVDRLPMGSRYLAAVLDDEDLARERVEAGIEPQRGSGRPPLLGETQDRMLLRAAVSALLRVEHAVYAAQAGPKAGARPRALLDPETAEDRIREQIAEAEVEDIFDAVAPGWRES